MAYLGKGWGDSVDDASIDDVRVAIEETQAMDEEHGAFWVGSDDGENVLEVSKDLNLIAVFDGNEEKEYRLKGKDWEEVKTLYELFLKERYDLVKNAFG
ncbi:hypothetical protein ACFQ4C_30110 [Larkinella insperata]|uniref:Uncharacterized protein n=1 Tax=Larkinella insperata TaxID=332158 RepID=A0ABW3QEP5_9BACT